MPFLNADDLLSSQDFRAFDHTVIGAGAAGTLVAIELARRGKRVLVLESGHFDPDEARQDLNTIEETGKRLGDAKWVRKRIIGGTTTAWGGQSLPFSPLDFERRDWVAVSGWPITYETLKPWYDRANAFMGCDLLNYDSDIDRLSSSPLPVFDPRLIHAHYSKWAREPNFQKLYKAQLAALTTVLYNGHLLRIDLGDDGRVSQIEVGNFRGEKRVLPTASLILAAGGIETNRILLLNDHQRAGGLGNTSGRLGRGFMEHPCIPVGWITAPRMRALQAGLGSRVHRMRRYGARLSAGPAWQTDTQSLNISASLLWLFKEGEVGPLTHLRTFLRKPRLALIPKIVGGLGAIAKGLWALAVEGFIYKPGAQARLVIMAEQEAKDDSFIALSEQVDSFGQRQARLHWSISDATWKTIVGFSQMLKGEFERTGLGAVRLDDHIRTRQPDWRERVTDVNHHMGGARMGSNPDDSVVDENLAVWGIDNLHVCSAAVFPTGSHSNPTLTLLALAARLADHLCEPLTDTGSLR